MSKMARRYCIVPGCTTHSGMEGVTLHYFPSELRVKNLWKEALNLHDVCNLIHQSVCSLHFKESDYHFNPFKMKRSVLKRGSVPSQNLSISRPESEGEFNNENVSTPYVTAHEIDPSTLEHFMLRSEDLINLAESTSHTDTRTANRKRKHDSLQIKEEPNDYNCGALHLNGLDSESMDESKQVQLLTELLKQQEMQTIAINKMAEDFRDFKNLISVYLLDKMKK